MVSLQVDLTSPQSFVADDGTLVHVIDPAPAMPSLTASAQLTEVPGDIELADVVFSWQLTIPFDEDDRSDRTTVPAKGWAQETGRVGGIQIRTGSSRAAFLTISAAASLPDGTHAVGDSTHTPKC